MIIAPRLVERIYVGADHTLSIRFRINIRQYTWEKPRHTKQRGVGSCDIGSIYPLTNAGDRCILNATIEYAVQVSGGKCRPGEKGSRCESGATAITVIGEGLRIRH